MVRIRIIGGPGSGKTTLAKELSARLHVPHYDLDDVHWSDDDTNYTRSRDREERRRIVQKIVRKKNWIIEGSFVEGWAELSIPPAEQIIVLTSSRWVRKGRILKRFIKRKVGVDKGKKEHLKGLYGLLRWNWGYDAHTLQKLEPKKYRGKTMYLKTNKEIQQFLENI